MKIILSNFIGYNRAAIKEFLLIHEENWFEISMLLYPSPPAGNKDLICSIYTMAGYVGQLLQGISNSFAYSVPGVEAMPWFTFQVKIFDMAELSNILYMTIQGIHTNGELFEQFHQQETIFWEGLCANEIKPAAWGLLHIANVHKAMR